jgi:hypothetical protein
MSAASQYRVRFKPASEYSASDSVFYSSSSYSRLNPIASQVQRASQREQLCLNKKPTNRGATAFAIVRSVPKKRSQSHQKDKTALARDITCREHSSSLATLPLPIHPVTILQKGNSDPFNSKAIPITAETSELLMFHESNVLPLIVACREAYGVSSSVTKENWHDSFPEMHDECTAYGLLARTAVVMSRSAAPGSRVAVQSLMYKRKTSELLRARLTKSEYPLVVSQVYPIVVSMLIGAVFEDALDEAAIHIKMLKHLLYTHSSRVDKEVDLATLLAVSCFDFHRASKALARPIFDFGGWLADRFRPGWQQALKELPALSGQAEMSLERSIDDEKLRGLFITVREILEIRAMVMVDPSISNVATQMSVAQWMLVCQGQLIDRYLDVMDVLNQDSQSDTQPTASFDHKWDNYTKAYLSLAALWWTRRLGRMESAPTTPFTTIFNTTIIPALKKALIQSNLVSDGLDAVVNSRVRLWALYVGAFAEQHLGRGLKMKIPDLTSEDRWFTKELFLQARRMNLLVWSDLRQTLQGFLYSDSLEPHGSTWFTGV